MVPIEADATSHGSSMPMPMPMFAGTLAVRRPAASRTPMPASDAAHDRALGALFGGALGDALGMPSQTLSPAAIRRTFGRIDRFVAAPDDHPVSHGLPAGSVTDDTEQTLLLAEIWLESGDRLDQRRWAAALDTWQRDVRARGGGDLLGPSTARAIAAIRQGDPPEHTGRHGDTNGAAMRIAPIGIATPVHPLERLVDRVVDASLATHHTGIAIAGAAAVAAAISTGIDGGDWRHAAARAIRAAETGAARGHWTAGASCAARVELALEIAARHTVDTTSMATAESLDKAATELADRVGTSVATQESVPCAFGIVALADGDPWTAMCLAANLGGDTDTIAAIAGAIGGACQGVETLPRTAIDTLRGIDPVRVRALAAALLARRQETART